MKTNRPLARICRKLGCQELIEHEQGNAPICNLTRTIPGNQGTCPLGKIPYREVIELGGKNEVKYDL